MRYKVTANIERDENGFFAWCPDLEGCHSQGDTLDEVLANIREAIEAYLEEATPEEREDYLKREVLTTSIEVNVA